MKQLANIVNSVRSLFLGNSALSAAIPGGLIYQTAQEGVPRPFGIIDCDLGETEFQSGASYIQQYLVRVRVYGDDAVGDAGNIQSLLETWLGVFTLLPGLTPPTRTLQIIQDPEGIDYDKDRKLGKHVLVAGQAWTISLQENRSLYTPIGTGH